jgi:hypothetical protein
MEKYCIGKDMEEIFVNYVKILSQYLPRGRLALTSPTSGGRSVGIVRLRAKATDFFSDELN